MRHELSEVYRVFSRYERPKPEFEGWPCCHPPRAGQNLCRLELHELTASDLGHYAESALLTWGNLRDYKYFLPRILELSEQNLFFFEVALIYGKFAHGQFAEWPDVERAVVEAYIGAFWKDVITRLDLYQAHREIHGEWPLGSTGPPTVNWTLDFADSMLCGAALFLDDVTPLLDMADAIAPEFRTIWFAAHYNVKKTRLTNGWWDLAAANYRHVLHWADPDLFPSP